MVIVLVEDARQEQFVRGYLRRLGFNHHAIRALPYPSGKGSGEQSVRQRYPQAVKDLRERQARTALVVAIDADALPVNSRHEQLRAALEADGQQQRQAVEAIVHLVPKWSIETWVLCLTTGVVLDEQVSYRRHPDVAANLNRTATPLFEWSRPNVTVPGRCVESLRIALAEVRRLDSLLR